MTKIRVIFEGRDRTKELVRIRDSHACRMCGRKWEEGTRRFDVHKVGKRRKRDGKRYWKVSEMPLLVTLCHFCIYKASPDWVPKELGN